MSPAPALADSDVGAALRAARKRREMSLEDIAKTTKIRVAILRAIEKNQRDELPDTIFLRGFVRSYAREVGLDPNDLARRYVEQFTPIVEPVQSGPESEERHEEKREPEPSSANDMISGQGVRGRAAQWATIALLVTAVIGYGIARRSQRDAGKVGPPKTERAEAAGTSGSLPPPAAAAPAEVGLHLNLRATARCWVSANVDGTRVMYALLQPGEEQTLDVRRDAVLRIGEPAALAVSIDGLPARSLGRPGTPVTVHITRDNYREFIAR